MALNRVLLDVRRDAEVELLAQGYERRTTAVEPRLSEVVEEYRRIGFDVQLVEHRVSPDSCGTCIIACQQAGELCADVYVRPPRRPDGAAP